MEELFGAYKMSIRVPQRTKQVGKLSAGVRITIECILETQYCRARCSVTFKGVIIVALLNFYSEIFTYKPSAVSKLFFQAGLLPIR